MIFAVGRDLAKDPRLEEHCRDAVFQQEDPYAGIPERLRIVFDIRDEVKDFVNRFIKPNDGTSDEKALRAALESPDISVRNMANALLQIRAYFNEVGAPPVEEFFRFFGNKVLLVYVSSPNLDDAFQMFTVLNDRGMKLRGSDILKTMNLRALRDHKATEEEIRKWAKYWEWLEGELLEDFDGFISHIRAILVKDKARLSLLKEFQDNIYNPMVFDRINKTYQKHPPLLRPGKDTFLLIERYYKHYQQILSGNNYKINNSWQFDNLLTLLSETSLADFWFPPLLRYREVFGELCILEFLKKLENKFCGDWITSQTPTDRISSMNKITATIDEINARPELSLDEKVTHLLASSIFDYDHDRYKHILTNEWIYGRRFARYLLFKIDVLLASADTRLQVPTQMSVEHILPQHPDASSQWCKDFNKIERETWTDKLGNLVLISRRKNSSQGRMDYKEKKAKYFKTNIEVFPNSLDAMQSDDWKMENLTSHHKKVIDLLIRSA